MNFSTIRGSETKVRFCDIRNKLVTSVYNSLRTQGNKQGEYFNLVSLTLRLCLRKKAFIPSLPFSTTSVSVWPPPNPQPPHRRSFDCTDHCRVYRLENTPPIPRLLEHGHGLAVTSLRKQGRCAISHCYASSFARFGCQCN